MLHFIFSTFPLQTRKAGWFLLLASTIFLSGWIASYFFVQLNEQAIYFLYGENQVINFTYMYDPQHIRLTSNSIENTTRQFLFYLLNNCWIAVKIFLGGLLLGLGSLAFLLYNAFSMGLLMGFLVANGYGATLWPTIIGHSSFELIATVISAAAGLKVGWAIIGPASCNLPRLQVIILEFKQALLLVYGALILFTIAGAIEAFWSSNNAINDTVKYITGGLFWLLLPGYLWLAGKLAASKV